MEVSFITYNINYYFLDSERVSEKKTRECKLQGLVLMSTRIILIVVPSISSKKDSLKVNLKSIELQSTRKMMVLVQDNIMLRWHRVPLFSHSVADLTPA